MNKQEQLNESLIKFTLIGDLNMVKLLLDRGADFSVKKYAALMFALGHGYTDIAKAMVDHNSISDKKYANILARSKKYSLFMGVHDISLEEVLQIVDGTITFR